jgi:phage terminase large subunit
MSKTIHIQTTISFEHLNESQQRVVQLIGGTRSGKSFGITQYLIVKALESKRDISVVRKTIPSLKRTNIKDFREIMLELGIWDTERFNISDRVYVFDNGSTFTFVNTDDPDKLRGFKSDILWLDEASEIDESSYFQLQIRTSERIILSYNPTVSPFHWLRQMVDCDRFITTYKDNPFLPAQMIKSIEDLETKNPKLWKIYGKGEFAPNERAIYQFEIVDDYEAEFVAFGLDWGWNDKMAMVAVYRNGDKLYVEEIIYESKMTMTDLVNRLKGLDVEREEIWCDSSEPRSVEELYRAGFNAKAVKKGPDSIKFGIGVLQNFKIHIKKDSQNLINEMYGYQYAQDKYGYTTDTPEEGLDHLLDAMRYVAMMKLSLKAQTRGTYAISIK